MMLMMRTLAPVLGRIAAPGCRLERMMLMLRANDAHDAHLGLVLGRTAAPGCRLERA